MVRSPANLAPAASSSARRASASGLAADLSARRNTFACPWPGSTGPHNEIGKRLERSDSALDGEHSALDGGHQRGVVGFRLVGVAPGESA
jgi:hypothetical protein